MAAYEKGRASVGGAGPLPKFGEWDVNDPASAEGFTVIFNKARDDRKSGGTPLINVAAAPEKYDSRRKEQVAYLLRFLGFLDIDSFERMLHVR